MHLPEEGTYSSQTVQPGTGGEPQSQAEARQYHRLRRRFSIGQGFLSLAYLVALLGSGASLSLAGLIPSSNPWIQMALFYVVLAAGYEILSLPLETYAGYTLPRRFGLSRQSPGAFLGDRLKSFLVTLFVGGIALEVLYWLLRDGGAFWPLWAAIGLLLFLTLGTYLAPIFLLPIFFKTEPIEDPALTSGLRSLGERAGTRVKGIYQFDLGRKTRAANAAVMGLWKTRRILLSDTLLADFTAEETGAVVAHELGHDRQGHLPKGILLQTGAGLLALYASDWVLGWGAVSLGLSAKSDVAGLPLLLLVFLVFGFLGGPFALALSRRIEAGCDAFALRLTGNPDAFISAMKKLSRRNLAEEAPSRVVEWLFYSHPPLQKRFEMAERHRKI